MENNTQYKGRVRVDLTPKKDGYTLYIEFKDKATGIRNAELTRRLDFKATSLDDKDAMVRAEMERIRLETEVNENFYLSDGWRKDFLALYEKVEMGKKAHTKKTYKYPRNLLKDFLQSKGLRTNELPFNRIDQFFVDDLQEFFIAKCRHINTSYGNFTKISHVLNVATKYGLIHNYLDVKPIRKIPCASKEILSAEDVSAMWAAYCKYDFIKVSVIFGVFSGLRISDLKSLQWKHILEKGNNEYVLNKCMSKTGKLLHIYIRPDVVRLLGKRGNDNDFIFPGFKIIGYHLFRKALFNWVKAAGIPKHITTHCCRKTFANLILNHTKRVEIMEKALGHVPNTIGMTNYGEILESELKEATLLHYFDVRFDTLPELDIVGIGNIAA